MLKRHVKFFGKRFNSLSLPNSDFGNLTDKKLTDETIEWNETEDIISVKKRFKNNSPFWYLSQVRKLVDAKNVPGALYLFEHTMVEEDGLPPINLIKYELTQILQMLINGCAHAGYIEKAFNLFEMMKKYKLDIDDSIYTSLLTACSEFDKENQSLALEKLNELRNYMREKIIPHNRYHYNALIKCYARLGGQHNIAHALSLMDEMKNVTKNNKATMISNINNTVKNSKALEENNDVNNKKYAPEISCKIGKDTFAQLLSAGVTEKSYGFTLALKIWALMKQCDIKPTIIHYNTLLRSCRDSNLIIPNDENTDNTQQLNCSEQAKMIDHKQRINSNNNINDSIKFVRNQNQTNPLINNCPDNQPAELALKNNSYHNTFYEIDKHLRYLYYQDINRLKSLVSKIPPKSLRTICPTNNEQTKIPIDMMTSLEENIDKNNENALVKNEPVDIKNLTLTSLEQPSLMNSPAKSLELLENTDMNIEEIIQNIYGPTFHEWYGAIQNSQHISAIDTNVLKSKTDILKWAKLSLLGGLSGLIEQIQKDKITPDTKQLTLLAEIVPLHPMYITALLNGLQFEENIETTPSVQIVKASPSIKSKKSKEKMVTNTPLENLSGLESRKDLKFLGPRYRDSLVAQQNTRSRQTLDSDFYLVLLKRYATFYSSNYKGLIPTQRVEIEKCLQNTIDLMTRCGHSLTVAHFGALAIACKNVTKAKSLIQDMETLNIHPNAIIVTTLASNADSGRDIPYMKWCISLCLKYDIDNKDAYLNRIFDQFVKHVDSALVIKQHNQKFPESIQNTFKSTRHYHPIALSYYYRNFVDKKDYNKTRYGESIPEKDLNNTGGHKHNNKTTYKMNYVDYNEKCYMDFREMYQKKWQKVLS